MAFSNEVGIDLGTVNALIFVKGKGIVLKEPSVVALNRDTGEVLAVGNEAKEMLGRTPGNIIAVRPLTHGVISDYDTTERMLRYFIKKTCGSSRFFKPRIMICVPSGVTEVEKRAVSEAASMAGAKEVFLMEEPIAAAIGAGLDIMRPDGMMIVDIGGGTTDIAILSLGGIVTSRSIKIAGDDMDDAIIRHMRKVHKIQIGERTAEQIKCNVGTAFPREKTVSMDCRGRDMITGLPVSVTVTSEEIYDALDECLTTICEAIHSVLEMAPPEIAADISTSGIMLTGGGALLWGIDKRIADRTRIPVAVAENPTECVAAGTGQALSQMGRISSREMENRQDY